MCCLIKIVTISTNYMYSYILWKIVEKKVKTRHIDIKMSFDSLQLIDYTQFKQNHCFDLLTKYLCNGSKKYKHLPNESDLNKFRRVDSIALKYLISESKKTTNTVLCDQRFINLQVPRTQSTSSLGSRL